MDNLTKENKAFRYDCFMKILSSEWSLAERTVYMKLISLSKGDLDHLDISPIAISDIAKQLNLHRQTVGNAINALKQAGLIDFEVQRVALDENGELLKGRKFNKKTDSIETTTFWNNARIPQELPVLQKTELYSKKIAQSFQFRSEFKDLKAKLKEYEKFLTCPYCHKTGHMKISVSAICECEDCKKWTRGKQLDELVKDFEAQTGKVEVPSYPISVKSVVEEIDTPAVPLFNSLSMESYPSLLSEKIKDVDADITEGAESVRRFGAHKAYVICKGRTKEPQGLNWTKKPRSLEEAVREVGQNNVGVLPEYCSVLGIDVDRHLTYFLQKYPELQKYSIVYRENDLERGKIIVPVSDMMPKFSLKDGADFGLKIEIIGSGGHFVIAGTHESGASIKILWGTENKILTCQRVADIAHSYIPTTIEKKFISKTIPEGKMPTWMILENYALLHKKEIAEFFGGNMERFSIRPDDNTPSVICTTKGFERDTWRDFGDQTSHMEYGKPDSSGRIWDLFDLYVLMKANGKLDNFKNIKRNCVVAAKEYFALDTNTK